MKNLIRPAVVLFCIFLALQSHAQNHVPVREPDYKKPRVFSDLPAKMTLKVNRLENFLALPVGMNVSTFITDQFLFQGKIVSKASETTHESVVIKSTNRPGVTLTFTRLPNGDGTYRYIGRIMSLSHGDAFNIVFENGNYIISKTDLYEIINE